MHIYPKPVLLGDLQRYLHDAILSTGVLVERRGVTVGSIAGDDAECEVRAVVGLRLPRSIRE